MRKNRVDGLARLAGMTAPAVQLDPDIGMARDAEVVLRLCDAAGLLAGMAFDTPREVVFRGAYALAEEFFAVVFEELRVVANDVRLRVHAMGTLVILQPG